MWCSDHVILCNLLTLLLPYCVACALFYLMQVWHWLYCFYDVGCWMIFHARWIRQKPRWTTLWRNWRKCCTCPVVYQLFWRLLVSLLWVNDLRLTLLFWFQHIDAYFIHTRLCRDMTRLCRARFRCACAARKAAASPRLPRALARKAALPRMSLPRHIDVGTHARDVPTTINIEIL